MTKQIVMGGITFDPPDGKYFQDGDIYYVPNLLNPAEPIRGIWPQHIPVHGWMHLIHQSKENAILHGLAISKINLDICQTQIEGTIQEDQISSEGNADHEQV